MKGRKLALVLRDVPAPLAQSMIDRAQKRVIRHADISRQQMREMGERARRLRIAELLAQGKDAEAFAAALE